MHPLCDVRMDRDQIFAIAVPIATLALPYCVDLKVKTLQDSQISFYEPPFLSYFLLSPLPPHSFSFAYMYCMCSIVFEEAGGLCCVSVCGSELKAAHTIAHLLCHCDMNKV